ncbi:putative LPS assembly protein LptD [Psychroflexus planctonicus]|uniref:Organic solvent tolerance protein OstA n=1 Tax=Psychroflexus planctonicus TaxID=1526575 RepID=A0ABQ1SCE6_9FLAO|nr:organic solvent tolerance protein OstA [Psychroflexus planctonicus]
MFFTQFAFSQEEGKLDLNKLFQNDSTDLIHPSLQPSYLLVQDSTETGANQEKKSMITDIVRSYAKDYKHMARRENKMYLYNEAKIEYQDMIIESGEIVLDNQTSEVTARGITDSTSYTQSPVFTQGGDVIEPDSLRYNFDTGRAIVYNSKTKQGGFTVRGPVSKRENDSVFFIKNAKFTTEDDVDNADYYFKAKKIKFVPNKKIVTGLVQMYIVDVPTPLALPFGYFPMVDKASSGFILPSFGDNRQRGFFLMNGGYYFAISDYLDLSVLGDYYSNGSWATRVDSDYAVRYKFNGSVSFRYENLLLEERGFPDFSEQTIFNFRWNHQQDAKANPNSRFSASVNIGSSRFFRESINQATQGNFLNNTMNSSVSYNKTINAGPGMNLNLTATHSQNTNTQEINMTLPTLQFSINRIFPFEPKTGTKKGAIQNINLQYNLRGENRIRTTDEQFLTPGMFNDLNAGMRHSIPITTNFKVFEHFSMSLNANYDETWVMQTYKQRFDEQSQEVVRDTIQGFDSFRTYNFSTSVGTTVYGMFPFGDDSKINAIRHVMRPSISYNVNPAFDQFYDQFTRPGLGATEDQLVEYSRFEGTLFGAPGNRFSSSMNFSLTNDFEAKVRNNDSTAEGDDRFKKMKLLNNFGLSSSYNFAADSLKFSPVALRGNIPIVADKFNVNVIAALDPYALDNNNRRINKLNINNGGSLFRLTNANVSFSYALSDKTFAKEEEDEKEDEDEDEEDDRFDNDTFSSGGRPDDLFGQGQLPNDPRSQRQDKEPKDDENEYYNYKIPWNLNLSYTMTYANQTRQSEIASHSVMFSGDIELSPQWKVGISSGYDLANQGFTFTQLRFNRDLGSFNMSLNWTPIGPRESWFFFIGIKANMLRDLKFDRNREPDRRLN